VAARHRVKAEAAKRWVHRGACGFNACGTAATIRALPSRPEFHGTDFRLSAHQGPQHPLRIPTGVSLTLIPGLNA
jgi:hypothetical protein